MENIQTCLDFLEYYGVSVNGVTADGKKKTNLSFRPLMIIFFSNFCYYVDNWGLMHHLAWSRGDLGNWCR